MENTQESEKQTLEKMNFFKKVWYSITKIEKYPEMSAQGLGKAIGYLSILVAIITLIICIGTFYKINVEVEEGIKYIQNELPEFSYSDGELKVDSEETIEISEEVSRLGKIIINTNEIDERTKEKYISDVTESESGIVLLKNEAIVKVALLPGTIRTDYKTELTKYKIDNFDKTSIIQYVNSSKMIPLYLQMFIEVFIYIFCALLIIIAINALYVSLAGYITSRFAGIKMRYVAIFNMSIYALTLSLILSMIYIGINMVTTFYIKYFQFMYDAVAVIYIVAAILLLKSEIIKKQIELMKIKQVEEIIKQQMEEKEQEDKDEKEKEERKKKDKEEEKGNEETPGEPCCFKERNDI